MNDEEILKKIGARLKELRLEQNIKQKDLSEKSGLSMFSISQIETGHNTSVLSLVQVLKALNRMDMLEPFIKEHNFDPELFDKCNENQQSTRKRVTTPRINISEEGQTIIPRPYFPEEDTEDNSQFLMAADDSEIEWTTKK